MHCHCQSCRHATGAPMTSFFGVGRAQVTWEGKRSFHNSSPGVTRGFCGQCGTPMVYMSTRWPGEAHLYAATLDDLTLYQPTAHVHWAERVPWFTADDSLPKYKGRAL
ncbi:MAG: GFA family protein [Pseudomonadota bacterium]